MRGKRIGEADHPGPPKTILDTGVRARRRISRLGQSLAGHRVAPTTLRRYERAMIVFFKWLRQSQHQVPSHPYFFDQLLAVYVEECWEEGEGRQFVLDTECGLGHRFKGLATRLLLSQDLSRAWAKAGLPARAPPMPLEVLTACLLYTSPSPRD